MIRMFTACLLALGLAGAVAAAPKDAAKAEKPCPAGVGKAVCCKASVADHCAYVSCCEQGNKGFFTAAHCAMCAKHAAKVAHTAHASCAAGTCDSAKHAAGNAYVSCCEQGNAGFFKAHGCGTCAAGKRGTPACCAAEAKKK